MTFHHVHEEVLDVGDRSGSIRTRRRTWRSRSTTTSSRSALLEVGADRGQTPRLLAWAELLGASGRGRSSPPAGSGSLLSQQLVAAGEHVVDVPPTLSARVRLLGSSKTTKNDRHDALVDGDRRAASLRSARRRSRWITRRCCGCWSVVTTTWSRCAPRPRVGCTRCCGSSSPAAHHVDCPLISAAKLLRTVRRRRARSAIERKRLAVELLADVRRLDRDLVAIKARITDAVAASNTTLHRTAWCRSDRRRASILGSRR